MLRLTSSLFALTLLGCASTPPRAPTTSSTTCAAPSELAAPGARTVTDDALLQRSVGAPEAGKLCAGTVYEATQAVTVWRVWQRDREHTQRGRWWSLARPDGPRERFRAAAVVCAEWSSLDALVRCEIRAGERFVVGPGQSARCEGGAVAAGSPALQVYIENDGRAGRYLVENCQDLGAWP